MGFADRYVASLGTSNLKDDERHHQAEPLIAAALACVGAGDIGALLHRAKYADTTTRNMARVINSRARLEKELAEAVRAKGAAASREAECRQALEGDAAELQRSVTHLAPLLRLWTEEVTKRGRARKWVPENTEWDATAAHKLYRSVAETSLAHWLDSTCKCCDGTGLAERNACKPCSGSGEAPVEGKGGFVLERTKDMIAELHNMVMSHAARAGAKLRPPRQ